MKPYNALFEKYRKGNLSESGIDELNHILVESYFLSPSELNLDELEYAEDLVIELYGRGKLEEKFAIQFKGALNTNKLLLGKFQLLRNLSEANEHARMSQMSRLLASGNTESEQEEEAQLAKILQEVIAKVHTEEETARVKSKIQIVISKIKNFIIDSIPSVIPEQPRLRTALAFASVIIIAGVVWVSIRPGDNQMISSNSGNDSIQKYPSAQTDSNQLKETEVKPEIIKPVYAYTDSARNKRLPKNQLAQQQKVVNTLDSAAIELDMALLAYADEIPSGIEYIELRSESTSANDLFINAAEKYNNQDYDGCALILKSLLKSNEFKSIDTLSEINYYLGIISMKKGFNTTNRKSLKQAVRYYTKVDKSSPYFNDSQWYSALSEIKLGNKTKGIQILNSLPENNYQRAVDVKLVKEKLAAVIHSN